ncbi:MAG: hypothetical protein F6K26_34605 [Moorea sp. SIO2I5]|nr:hypothetical protein [Moorena sp. SIO2I5]
MLFAMLGAATGLTFGHATRCLEPLRDAWSRYGIDLWSRYGIDLWSRYGIDLWSRYGIDLWSRYGIASTDHILNSSVSFRFPILNSRILNSRILNSLKLPIFILSIQLVL